MNPDLKAGALAKPEKRGAVDKREKRQAFLKRRQVREIVYRRDRMRCVRCDRALKHPRECYPTDPEFPHVNEIVPRSKGGDPLDADACELLCGDCHMPGGRHAPTAERQAILTGQQKGKA